MTFPRPEPDAVAAPDAPPPLRTFTYKTWAGHVKVIQAHYLQFMTEHVTFWLQREGAWDFMVLAEANRDCQAIKETHGNATDGA